MSDVSAPLLATDFARRPRPDDPVDLSVVLPMHNEVGNAADLVQEIRQVFAEDRIEIIAVDDASTDGTAAALMAIKDDVAVLRVLSHASNAGQSRALRTGILAARGRIIATLDGDGQNVPGDIPALLARLVREDAPPNLAMVAGERQARQDSRAKLVASRAANRVRKLLLRDAANDTGCGLKVFFREAFLRLPYFDHVHRYLPALICREGFEVEFLPVAHRPRRHGVSKYTNLGRAGVAVRDLFGVVWLNARAKKPGRIREH